MSRHLTFTKEENGRDESRDRKRGLMRCTHVEDALKALGIASTLLDPHDKISSTAISRKQRELRGKKADELDQTNIDSFFTE